MIVTLLYAECDRTLEANNRVIVWYADFVRPERHGDGAVNRSVDFLLAMWHGQADRDSGDRVR